MSPLLMAQMSRLVYEPWDKVENRLRSEGFSHIHIFERAGTEAFLAKRQPDGCVLAFRGTEPASFRDWLSDIRCLPVGGPVGNVHRGFRAAFEQIRLAVFDRLCECVGVPIYLTGHSLGAALATLCAAEMLNRGIDVAGLCTFGSPRVGDRHFATFVRRNVGDLRRYVNCTDVVTRVPRLFYWHAGNADYINADGRLLHNPPAGYMSFDRLRARCRRAPLGPGIGDHSMDAYVRLLRAEKDRA